MQFLYPFFLWGLLAAAIPLIIHLFNFRRTKKVYFTNVAFLRAVNTTTSSFRRLKHLLIMAARMAFIIALVLAFAQPFIPSKSGSKVKIGGITSLYIDNSLSMQNELDKKTYLDKAISKTEELLLAFPQGSKLQLVTNDFSADEHAIGNTQQIKERTTSIKFTHSPRTLEQVLNRQKNLASKHNSQGGNQYVWFSDFQKSTAGNLSKLTLDSNSHLFVVPVQAKALQNIFVDSVWLNTPFVREMQVNQLSVKLFNTGEKAVENLPVKLLIDGLQVSSTIATIPAKSSTVSNFSFNIQGKGFKKANISFDDTPITFDNDYFFVLNVAPKIKVLHLFGQNSGDKYLPAVFANDSIFAFKSYGASNIDVGIFKTVDFIILEGLQSIEGSMKTALTDFVRAGGSLMVIPNQSPDLNSYNAFLSVFNIRNIQDKNINTESTPLAEPAKSSSFFADIFDNTTQKEIMQMPNQQAVINWQAVGDKLLSFRNNQAFLTVSPVEKGKLYLLAAPLAIQYGEFARNALFVPIMYKIAAQSVIQEQAAFSFEANTIAIVLNNVKADLNGRKSLFTLKRNKMEFIPVQNLVGNTLMIELPKANQLNDNQVLESGYYELLLDGQLQKVLAFNHDHNESMMDFYSVNELKNIFSKNKNIEVFDKIDDADLVDTFKEQNFGISLWKYFLIAALAFLLIEIAIIKMMK
ncbi:MULTISPECIES: BatA domain-containing protein [unclassified Arcicella]|uniref:BatA domain-containing protein n=1 Tax=unclassified Arcicella TaxID=2644986 RepID=UPI00286190C4|nr:MULTISPECIES: BatA domain-containing protein [unclassified Arcicella]MDR6560885.1 hypothetical protein [Arcicella sp. BE51]MDR6810769.1 hypothetical protein [Arcicella sp. BE140]MDR6822119.1 hypothetical protein [Arcicella sp. BE139]